MRDVDDRHAGGCEPPHHGEQHFDLGVGENRGRLVQNQDLGVAGQCLGDGNLLLLGDREITDHDGGIAGGQTQQAEQFDHLGGLRVPIDPALLADLATGEDVLRNGQLAEKLRLLVDGGDAEGHRRRRGGDRHLMTLEADGAGVGGLRARQDLDHRRLAGAVLTDQRQHLADVDRQICVADRPHRAETLADAGHLQPDGPGLGHRVVRCQQPAARPIRAIGLRPRLAPALRLRFGSHGVLPSLPAERAVPVNCQSNRSRCRPRTTPACRSVGSRHDAGLPGDQKL